MRKAIVEPYTSEWKLEFDQAHRFYLEVLEGLDIEIEHVGSTSVPGMWAKPILDIDIIVKNTTDREVVINRLESIGYLHLGDLGVEEREAFKNPEDYSLITSMPHNLYVCMAGCDNLRNHLLLRKHLRDNEGAVRSYSELKRALAKKYPNDIDVYVEEKTALITKFLKVEGMDSEKLDRMPKSIRRGNEKPS